MSRRMTTCTSLLFVLLLAACSDNAALESAAEPEETQTPSDGTPDTDPPATSDPQRDVLTVDTGQPPFSEPDLEAPSGVEEIAEDPATEPTEVVLDADPGDGGEVAQAGLAAGESALCATIQIGLDAAADGAEDLAQSQRRSLIERSDALSDPQLTALVTDIADEPLVEVAVLADALDRCVNLGFER